MANASLQGNVAQEMARRRVVDELIPRQNRLNELYGPPDIPIPEQVTPYQTFDQPTDDKMGVFGIGYGGSPDSVASSMSVDSAPGAAVPASVAFANTMQNVMDNPLAVLTSPITALVTAIAAPAVQDAFIADQATQEAAISLDAFGPTDGVSDPTDPSSVGAVNGADAASDAAASAGSGGSSSKIVCTAMNKAYGFGAYRQAIWLDYSAKRLTKQHERGYHRIFRPLVRYAFHSGNSFAKRNVRRFLEYIMRLRTADIRAEMRGKNTHPIRRVVRRVCEYICYLAGKS